MLLTFLRTQTLAPESSRSSASTWTFCELVRKQTWVARVKAIMQLRHVTTSCPETPSCKPANAHLYHTEFIYVETHTITKEGGTVPSLDATGPEWEDEGRKPRASRGAPRPDSSTGQLPEETLWDAVIRFTCRIGCAAAAVFCRDQLFVIFFSNLVTETHRFTLWECSYRRSNLA